MNETKTNFWVTTAGGYVITAICYAVIWGLSLSLASSSQNLGALVGLVCAFFGWRALNRIQPAMFVWMPLVGWIIYFFVKLCLSILLGEFLAPYYIGKKISAYIQTVMPEEVSVSHKTDFNATKEISAGNHGAALTTGCKVWFWLIFICNILTILLYIGTIAMSTVAVSIGICMIVLCAIHTAGIALLLFLNKKFGFYLVITGAVFSMIANIWMGTSAVYAIVMAAISPCITFYFISKNKEIIQ